jgi:hypothetical protein
MAIHAITFRLEYDNTYEERWSSVVAAIRNEAANDCWEEPTSFFLIESNKNSKTLAESIDKNSSIDTRKDLLLVINLTEKGYTPLGKVNDDSLHRLMKKR